jgi:hypothetical protein
MAFIALGLVLPSSSTVVTAEHSTQCVHVVANIHLYCDCNVIVRITGGEGVSFKSTASSRCLHTRRAGK